MRERTKHINIISIRIYKCMHKQYSSSTAFSTWKNWEATTKLAIQLQNNILDFYGQNSTIGHYLLAVIMILAIPWPIIPQKNPTEPYMTPCNLNSFDLKPVQTTWQLIIKKRKQGSGPAIITKHQPRLRIECNLPM